MKMMTRTWLYLSSVMWLAVMITAWGDESASTQNPYQAIHARNGFALRQGESAPPASAPPVAVVATDYFLTGIVTLDADRYALVTHRLPGKAAEYLTLKTGDKQGGLEVLEIDERGSTVKARVNGVLSSLIFVKPSAPPVEKEAALPPLPK